MKRSWRLLFIFLTYSFCFEVMASSCLIELLRLVRFKNLVREVDVRVLSLDNENRALNILRRETRQKWKGILQRMQLQSIDTNLQRSYAEFVANNDDTVLTNPYLIFYQNEVDILLSANNTDRLDFELRDLLFNNLLSLRDQFHEVDVGSVIRPLFRRAPLETTLNMNMGAREAVVITLDNRIEMDLVINARSLVREAGVTGVRHQGGESPAINLLLGEDFMAPGRFFLYRLWGQVLATNKSLNEKLMPYKELYRDLMSLANELGVDVYFDSSLDITNVNLGGLYLPESRQIRLSPSLLASDNFLNVLRHELEHARFHTDLMGLAENLRGMNLRLNQIPLDIVTARQRQFITLAQSHLILENKKIEEIVAESYLDNEIGQLIRIYDEGLATEATSEFAIDLKMAQWELFVTEERRYGYSYVENYFLNNAGIVARVAYHLERFLPKHFIRLMAVGGAAYVLYRLKDGIWDIIVQRENGHADYYRIPHMPI